MSLKAFHIFFISLSALMCTGIGVMRAQVWLHTGALGALVQAVAGCVAGVALLVYGRRFLKKTKALGYL